MTVKNSREPVVYFADIRVDSLSAKKTLPAKYIRMLEKLDLPSRVKGKSVAVKMHFGGDIGYTTIHPLFIRLLVDKLKEAGAKSVKAMDNNPATGVIRGYTEEVLGCPVVSSFGKDGKNLRKQKIGFKGVDEVEFAGEALDCDFFLDLSHAKGHGACGFGGALKNIAMGVIPPSSRGKVHGLEGGIIWDRDKCTFCLKCVKACPNDAMNYRKEEKQIGINYHNCTGCQHCILACAEGAVRIEKERFSEFSEGMARVTEKFLGHFSPENLLFINVLTSITIYCDCWGFSTASLVPDIGILASTDIAAIDTASLDMIKTENLLESGLPKGRELLDVDGHLFEKIHGKDPYMMLRYLEEIYDCSSKYRLEEIK